MGPRRVPNLSWAHGLAREVLNNSQLPKTAPSSHPHPLLPFSTFPKSRMTCSLLIWPAHSYSSFPLYFFLSSSVTFPVKSVLTTAPCLSGFSWGGFSPSLLGTLCVPLAQHLPRHWHWDVRFILLCCFPSQAWSLHILCQHNAQHLKGAWLMSVRWTEEASSTQAQRNLEQEVNDSPLSCFQPLTVGKNLTAPQWPLKHQQRFQTSTLPFLVVFTHTETGTPWICITAWKHSHREKGFRLGQKEPHAFSWIKPLNRTKHKVEHVPLRWGPNPPLGTKSALVHHVGTNGPCS